MIKIRLSLVPVLVLLLSAGYGGKTEKLVPQTITYAIRLKPGEDLRKSIQAFVDDKGIKAGWIASCAGSLMDYHLRFANMPTGSKGSGHFEIVSLSGTLSTNGNHLHLSISDGTGHTIGGHLMDECVVYTTAEIIIQSSPGLEFTREKDGTTDWPELQIKSSPD
jgi:predicted DNA-binding protein with PD1-like motif